jgi:hypothetical protein
MIRPGIAILLLVGALHSHSQSISFPAPDTCELHPEIIGDTIFCSGEQSTLGASPAFATYLWSIGATSQFITVSVAGTYCLTVVDSDGCTGDTCVDVVKGVTLESVPDNIYLCDGEAPVGMTIHSDTSYTCEWNFGLEGCSVVLSEPGEYCVTVTDQNLCTASTCFTVHTVNPPQVHVHAPLYLCPNDYFTISCPQEFVSCELNGKPFSDPFLIGPGDYEFSLIDQSGCRYADSFHIAQGNVTYASLEVALCEDEVYLLNGQVFSEAGSFEVILENSNALGCDSIIQLKITETVLEVQHSITGDPSNGTAAITLHGIQGGTSPYTYLWNTGATTPGLRELFRGIYSVTITDASGCATALSFILPKVNYDWRPDKPTDVFPNPFRDEITIVNELGDGNTWNARIIDAVGTELMSIQSTKSLVNLPIQSDPGIYFVVITDHLGQTQTYKVIGLR